MVHADLELVTQTTLASSSWKSVHLRLSGTETTGMRHHTHLRDFLLKMISVLLCCCVAQIDLELTAPTPTSASLVARMTNLHRHPLLHITV